MDSKNILTTYDIFATYHIFAPKIRRPIFFYFSGRGQPLFSNFHSMGPPIIKKRCCRPRGGTRTFLEQPLVSSDIKFIRREQKQRKNSEACRASLTCFWGSLINLISKNTNMVFYLSCINSRLNGEKTVIQMKSRRNFVQLAAVTNAL